MTPEQPTLPEFTELGARKLAELQANGYRITGYCFERQVEGTQPQRGFIDSWGFVGWWRPEMMPDLSQLTERGAVAWKGVDPQQLREGGAL